MITLASSSYKKITMSLLLCFLTIIINSTCFSQNVVSMPEINSATSDPNFNFKSFIDSTDKIIKNYFDENTSENYDDFENSVEEYQRWKWFWKNRAVYNFSSHSVSLSLAKFKMLR